MTTIGSSGIIFSSFLFVIYRNSLCDISTLTLLCLITSALFASCLAYNDVLDHFKEKPQVAEAKVGFAVLNLMFPFYQVRVHFPPKVWVVEKIVVAKLGSSFKVTILFWNNLIIYEIYFPLINLTIMLKCWKLFVWVEHPPLQWIVISHRRLLCCNSNY